MLTWWYPYRLEFQSQEAALFMQLLWPLLSRRRFCAFACLIVLRDAVDHPRQSQQGGVGDLEPPRTFIFYAVVVPSTRNSMHKCYRTNT